MAVFLPEENTPLAYIERDFGYEYPNGLNLKPGSPLHERIKTNCLSMARMSQGVMSQRHAMWDMITHKLTAFISQDLRSVLQKQEDPNRPIPIVVPLAYANFEITLSYLMSILLGDPVFRYDPTEPRDKVAAGLLELLISFQYRKARNFLAMYSALQDCLRYGLGIIHCKWDVTEGQRTYMRDVIAPSNIVPGESYIQKPAGAVERYVAFEGNVFECIDPYLYFPDTGVPLYRPQDGEFVSWLSPGNNRVKLQEMERLSEGRIFNVKYLQFVDHRSALHMTTNREVKVGGINVNGSGSAGVRRPIDILWMYRNLIPAEEELGDSEEMEQWMFGIANDSVVIAAQPTYLDHRRCPLVVMAPEADGHTIMPIARMELVQGAQEVVDFEFNSHVASVSKILRDTLVIDPGLLNLESLRDGGIMRHLFLRRSVAGLGKIDQAVKQLNVYDPTVNNVRDVQITSDLAAMALGTAESTQGMRNAGRDRVTAAEVRDVRTGQNSRLNKVAAVIYSQAFMDLGDIQAMQTRQLMQQETFLKVTGRYRDDLIKEFNIATDQAGIYVTPDMIDVDFDTAATDVFAFSTAGSNEWIQMYQMLLQNPDGVRDVDLTRVFLYIARLLGERNAHDFLRKPDVTVQSDATVESEVQAGNIIPASGL